MNGVHVGDEKLVITETGFITEFLNQYNHRPDRPFCFILGAGVSRPSGIPAGGEMASVWLREMYEAENFDGLGFEEWATEERLEIERFSLQRLAAFYPQLYRRRYGDHEQDGYAYLESQMEGKEPSYGYSVLAYLLSETPHRVVITTNFDNLVADALSIHSSRFPLVIGHDALAQFAAVELRRPLVAKIHGALGFAPKSHPDEIGTLSESWKGALQRIFERYTPVVIGYEGNDGSLMGFLRDLPKQTPDRVLWCVYAPGAKPGACLERVTTEVLDYVRERRGRFVPISGFDELMAKLLIKLGEIRTVPDLYERLKERARQRELAYDEQLRRLSGVSMPSKHPEPENRPAVRAPAPADALLSQAVSEIAEGRKEKPWWVWAQDASRTADPDAREAIYGRALAELPENPKLLRAYALFAEQVQENFAKADDLYRRSIRADPNDASTLAFYADFLQNKQKDMEGAELYYRRSLALDPDDDFALVGYADFLHSVRNDLATAIAVYERAVKAAPDDPDVLLNYADLLAATGRDPHRAVELYERIIGANPDDSFLIYRYAAFLRDKGIDPRRAEELEERARHIDEEG